MKSIYFFVLILLGVGAAPNVIAQNVDPVLFTVEGKPVHVSEFNYIYNKNNGDKADYSKASIMEYLDLYQKFKLKVQKARDMELDTIPALIDELAGYRRQLADSYLTDKEVTENLIKEVYERQKQDVKVRHIVIRVNERATLNQQMEAREKIEEVKESIEKGMNFETAARSFSQDVNTRNNGGELNYLTAMLPNGYYEFENAMYSLEKGEVSEIIRSNVGFHLLQVIDKRPARGKIEAAHILLRKKNKGQDVPGVKTKIDSIYSLLQNGGNFVELARKHSEDSNSKNKGGNIGEFGIGTYEVAFEDAAFALENDGDISQPVETSIGWHIIKRINKPEMPDYEKSRRLLQAQIKKDSRYEIAKENMIENIKEKAGIEENKALLTDFINKQDQNFYSYRWDAGVTNNDVLFTLDENPYSLADFARFCKENTRTRLRFNKTMPVKEAVETLYSEYVNQEALKYEEANLENNYPEFKALMREYEEGILLFEATKINVWDKASQDTTGLNAYFEKNRDQYMWKERADLATFTINSNDEKLLKKIAKYAKKKSASEVLTKFNKEEEIITLEESKFERGDLELSGIKFKENAISEFRYDTKEETNTLRKITKIYPATFKTMKDARGYIIADYQDFLDKRWVEKLRNEYDVTVNEQVLQSIIKS